MTGCCCLIKFDNDDHDDHYDNNDHGDNGDHDDHEDHDDHDDHDDFVKISFQYRTMLVIFNLIVIFRRLKIDIHRSTVSTDGLH